jgi:hypothetical protein
MGFAMTKKEFKNVRIEDKIQVGSSDKVYHVRRVLDHAFALDLVEKDQAGKVRGGTVVPAERCMRV